MRHNSVEAAADASAVVGSVVAAVVAVVGTVVRTIGVPHLRPVPQREVGEAHDRWDAIGMGWGLRPVG